MQVPPVTFTHLQQMSDDRGTFEHALLSTPRLEHGYCSDDMARLLIVATRQGPSHDEPGNALAQLALRFLAGALGPNGGFRNRMNQQGVWEDAPAFEDAWGRSVWGLGFAAAHSGLDSIRQSAGELFTHAARGRSVWPRAMAFAALGAAEMLSAQSDHLEARALLIDAADAMPLGNGLGNGNSGHSAEGDRGWSWPEPRLSYANAVVPESMIAAGVALDRPELLARGLSLLAWLLEHETRDGHLSVTPVGGMAPGERGPAFDQQPIEVAALADACRRAASVEAAPGSGAPRDIRWADGVDAAVAWFLGENDSGAVMWDPRTGGGYDGLEVAGVNLNQGAESTLAFVSTLQQARRLVPTR
jgi:hypothetical protein